MNGSSREGCSASNLVRGFSNCGAPRSTILFDGFIPTLDGLDGDRWASQLLTLQIDNPRRREIIFDFRNSRDYMGVRRVELTMFNCPAWGIAVETIGLLRSSSISGSRIQIERVSVETSCDSLVQECISITISGDVIFLQFFPAAGSNKIYLAEVRFYDSSSDCTPGKSPLGTTIPPLVATTRGINIIPEATPERNSGTMPLSFVTIAIAASIGGVVLLIVCLLATLFIMWRCYFKRRISYHIDGPSNQQSVAMSRRQSVTVCEGQSATVCEDTGEVYYSAHGTPERETGVASAASSPSVRDWVVAINRLRKEGKLEMKREN